MDLEISLVKAFNWSLHEIDETSIESMLPFIARFAETNGGKIRTRTVFADQAGWL